eukprot:149821-Chlamydomonas_euryale.AAC.1
MQAGGGPRAGQVWAPMQAGGGPRAGQVWATMQAGGGTCAWQVWATMQAGGKTGAQQVSQDGGEAPVPSGSHKVIGQLLSSSCADVQA